MSATMHASRLPDPAFALLHDVGDVLELGILTLDRRGVIAGWNRWLEIASGRGCHTVLGKPLVDVYPEFRGTYGERALPRVLAGATVVMAHRFHEYFLPFPPPAGEREFRHMQQSTRLVPHIDPDGVITGVIVVIEDVTERVAREADLFRALHKAEAANQAKSEFLATMSHELRTPLGAISGYVDLLLQEIAGPVPESQRGHLMRVKGLSSHILRIVDEILTFSRLQAGREEAHVSAVDADVIARNAAGAVDPLMRRRGLNFRLDLPGHPVPLVTDEVKLAQILINLLGNAAKFVHRGEVTLSVQPDDDHVQFRVRDTGPGIEPGDLERIFEPFTQVDTRLTRQEQGTGLGLPVSRQLARLLGGDVIVESQPGSGATFTVTIPRYPVSATQ